MSLKQELLASLAEIATLYEDIQKQGLQANITILHQQRERTFRARYNDYWQRSRYQPALSFILSDVYSALNHEPRDTKVAKAFNSMSRVLPDAMLETITRAVSYNRRMLAFDRHLAEAIEFESCDDYYDYLEKDPQLYEQHKVLVDEFIQLARNIHHFVKKPFMQMTLKASRIPAKAANLLELQDFLERCFNAFKSMRDPSAFLNDYAERELAVGQA